MVAEPIFWNHFSIYYSYGFEVLFVTLSYLFFKSTTLWKKTTSRFLFNLLASLGMGIVTHHTAKYFNLIVPFDFSSLETVILLLFVAPILEEAIFRMAIWDAFSQFTDKKWKLIFITSFLFMAGHASAYWIVPAEYKGFVLYQSAYVFLLGLFLGQFRFKTSSLNAPILIHFSFNLGFLLSAKFLL